MGRTWHSALMLAAVWVGVESLVGGAQPAAVDAATVLASTRQALGGEAVLSSVHSLVIEGSRSANPAACEGKVEVVFELPDKFAYLEWHGARGRGCAPVPRSLKPRDLNGYRYANPSVTNIVRRRGLLGGVPFYASDGPTPPRSELPNSAPELEHLRARYLLPLFASSLASYPLTFTYAGQKDLDGKPSDLIEARGADGFVFRLFVDRKTHLPARLIWMAPPPGWAASASGAAPMVEYKMAIGSYRRKGGMNWPRTFRVNMGDVQGANGVVEDIWGLVYTINATIDPSTFKSPN